MELLTKIFHSDIVIAENAYRLAMTSQLRPYLCDLRTSADDFNRHSWPPKTTFRPMIASEMVIDAVVEAKMIVGDVFTTSYYCPRHPPPALLIASPSSSTG